MKNYFEAYEKISQKTDNATLINGRYASQTYAERFIPVDVIEKLEICEDDTVLDIGCGAGVLMFPISCVCKKIYGIDNSSVIEKLKRGFVPGNVDFIAGSWLDIDPAVFFRGGYTKVIIYSVLHCLKDLETAFLFVDKALEGLRENGKILLGDIPNIDKKRRFLQSASGKTFDEAFRKEQQLAQNVEEDFQRDNLKKEQILQKALTVDDEVIQKLADHYHNLSCDVYLLPQKGYLPFGHTRDDRLIIKR